MPSSLKPTVLSFVWTTCGSPWDWHTVGLMKHIDSDGSPTTGESELAARKLAAQILGRLGGKAAQSGCPSA